MFDIGWSELLIIGIVALIVVGPKDLPGMFRTLGRFTGKMKGMAREFQRAMNQAADESGVKDISKEIKMAASPKKFGFDTVRSAAKEFQEGLVGDDVKPTKPKPAAAKASAGSQESSEERKSDSVPGGKVGDGSESASSKVEGKTAAPQQRTDGAASENPNTIEKPPTEVAEKEKSTARAESDGKLSASPNDTGATVPELDEQARRAESNS